MKPIVLPLLGHPDTTHHARTLQQQVLEFCDRWAIDLTGDVTEQIYRKSCQALGISPAAPSGDR